MDLDRGADLLLDGRRALDDARWEAARAAFEAALGAEETADAYDGLGQALWFLGSVEEGIAARERAFDGYAREGSCDHAARVAVWVSHQHHISGRASAARGWLSRAERTLEGAGPCAGHGWVAVERARHAETVEECAGHAQRAMAIARESGAGDLEVFALSLLGRAQVRLFGDSAVQLEFARGRNPWRFDSPEHWVVFMETHYGPTLKARERLTAEGRWEDCRREIVAMAERRNEATDGSVLMHSEYLVTVGRKAG